MKLLKLFLKDQLIVQLDKKIYNCKFLSSIMISLLTKKINNLILNNLQKFCIKLAFLLNKLS